MSGLGLAVAVAVFPFWLVTARRLYGRWRGWWTTESGDPVPEALVAWAAMLLALGFPLVWAHGLVRWHPPVTEEDRRRQVADIDRRTRELEAELDVKWGIPGEGDR